MDFLSKPMGWILAQLSDLCGGNFALSVVIFTVVVNILMLPLTIKAQKSSAKQAKIKPKMDALKKKYGNDKQKYSMAVNELYTKEKVSMSGGCLPMVVRLLVMMGVYWAVASPLTFVLNIDNAALSTAKNWSAYVATAEESGIDWKSVGLDKVKASKEAIDLAAKYDGDVEYYAKVLLVEDIVTADKKYDSKSTEGKIKTLATKDNAITREVVLVDKLSGKHANQLIVDKFAEKGGDLKEIETIDFDLFGINLAETPDFSWNFSKANALWLIPLFSFATAMISSIVSMKIQKKANPDAPNMAGMMLIMPIFSLIIAFGVPGAVGFYWGCSNVISGGLQSTMQLVYGPNAMAAKEQSKSIIERAKVEQQKIERVRKREEISDK